MGKSSRGKRKRVLLKRVSTIFDKVNEHTDKTYWQPMTRIMCDLVCMKAAGWSKMDYETLMAVSGLGSSFVYKPIKHKPLNDYAFCTPPEGFFERVKASTGAAWDWRRYKTPEGAWRVLKKVVDSGAPVRVPWMEDAILAGYEEADDKKGRKAYVLCEPFAKPGKWWNWDEFVDWHKNSHGGWMGRLKKKKAIAPARRTAMDILKTFVEVAKSDPRGARRGFKDVKTGLAGIAAYADDIAEGEGIGGGWRGCHCAYPQISGRPSAAQYLAKLGKSKVLDKPEAAHVLAAADYYKAAAGAWNEWGRHLGHKAPKNAWKSKKHRAAGAAAICEALKQETLAIDEIGKALANMG